MDTELNRLDELLKRGWNINLNVSSGKYYIYAYNWDIREPLLNREQDTLKAALEDFFWWTEHEEWSQKEIERLQGVK